MNKLPADYISLNVPGLLKRYSNPLPTWPGVVLAWAQTQLELFRKYGLIRDDAAALSVPIEEVVIRFSDYTPKGQEFVRTGAVDKWLASCDKKGGSVGVFEDPTPLEKRIKKFLESGSK